MGDGVLFEVAEFLFGAFYYCVGDAGELGDLDAVALVGGADVDFVEENDGIAVFYSVEVDVADIRVGLGRGVNSK